MSENQKVYLDQEYQKSLSRMAEIKDNEANLQKKGIDRINVAADFWGFNKSEAERLCGLKQKFYFAFSNTRYNDAIISGGSKTTMSIYCSREFLDRDPVYGYSRAWKDQVNSRILFYNSSNRDVETNHNLIQAEIWEKNKPKTNKEKAEAMSSIKKTCKDFGFKEGTEKFAECLKDLYLKDNAQNSQPIIVQQGDSGSKALADEMKAQRHQRTYDELLGLGQELSKGRSLGEIYGGAPPKSGGGVSCNLTNSVMSGTNRICYYRCGVSTQTSNVGAAQQCPLTM